MLSFIKGDGYVVFKGFWVAFSNFFKIILKIGPSYTTKLDREDKLLKILRDIVYHQKETGDFSLSVEVE